MDSYDIGRIRAGLNSGEFTLPGLVDDYISRIEGRNAEINAFTSIRKDYALKQAAIIQKKIDAGTAGPLAGVVMGIKEVLCQDGLPATCASRMLASYEAVYNATVIERLESQDAILIGRLNMDEFAMGSSTENSMHGPARNPRNTSRVTGGSSGGSAAAVAASMCTAALGTDTGGSIRQPASFCGVVGLKPTYGRVSRHGLIAYASSFDCIGPLARSVSDAAEILKVIAGKDPRDATSSSLPVPDYPAQLRNLKYDITIGVPEEYFGEGLDPEISGLVMEVANGMKERGAKLVPIRLPHLKYAIAAYYVLATAEASSNLARFDGIRYGHRADMRAVREQLKSEEASLKKRINEAAAQAASAGPSSSGADPKGAKSSGADPAGRITGTNAPVELLKQQLDALDTPMIRLYKQSRTEGFGTEVKRRIMLGTYVLSAGYYDAYYGKAQRIRRLIKQDFINAFSGVDVIISPTAPTTAFELGSNLDDPVQMYLNDIYTISANLAGICGISVPAGDHSRDGMPVGVQFMANTFGESELLNAARIAEEVSGAGDDA